MKNRVQIQPIMHSYEPIRLQVFFRVSDNLKYIERFSSSLLNQSKIDFMISFNCKFDPLHQLYKAFIYRQETPVSSIICNFCVSAYISKKPFAQNFFKDPYYERLKTKDVSNYLYLY